MKKQILIGGALVASYALGVLTANKAEEVFYGATHLRAQTAQGFSKDFGDWHKERRINEHDNIETFLSNGRTTLPCLEGELGIQIGTDEYVMKNMPPQRRAAAIETGYDSLSVELQGDLADTVLKSYCNQKWEQFKQGVHNCWNYVVGGN